MRSLISLSAATAMMISIFIGGLQLSVAFTTSSRLSIRKIPSTVPLRPSISYYSKPFRRSQTIYKANNNEDATTRVEEVSKLYTACRYSDVSKC